MNWLTDKIEFPSYQQTSREGIIALGGDLSEERLLHAYQNGIFPWFSEGDPIVWYCPLERMVLFPEEVRISKSMQKIINKNDFKITENSVFKEVIYNCKNIARSDGFGTWITDDMEDAYLRLHEIGVAKSIEVWYQNKLVGGLYGLEINNVFCGESMFSFRSNASKLAFIYLAKSAKYKLIDCQIHNDHLASLGAKEIERSRFLNILKEA
ncbi:Leucyltransferase [Polaribacter irgensii 23-P]|uniref:Leucyl/phenylalanyl-tRNA--protein transferase n=1 Tax=Polaribacter irgensii 23-P TaxID=313594 RepID=A4BW51_9FLAO|nr:leucyl/phenylalanyl-tRNA--protein transferase [Polaribacter irgensii]EAR13192.1 Leucyltransferase [Polaribacter irgensii 23-P]